MRVEKATVSVAENSHKKNKIRETAWYRVACCYSGSSQPSPLQRRHETRKVPSQTAQFFLRCKSRSKDDAYGLISGQSKVFKPLQAGHLTRELSEQCARRKGFAAMFCAKKPAAATANTRNIPFKYRRRRDGGIKQHVQWCASNTSLQAASCKLQQASGSKAWDPHLSGREQAPQGRAQAWGGKGWKVWCLLRRCFVFWPMAEGARRVLRASCQAGEEQTHRGRYYILLTML